MKRRARDHLPKRSPGAFPAFLYKSLDDLEGVWPVPSGRTDLIDRCDALHSKRLIILTDNEVELAIRQRVGFPWMLQLAVIRLRQDPLRDGDVYGAGDLLRAALLLRKSDWGSYLTDIQEIADAVTPTLDADDPDFVGVLDAYSSFGRAG